MPKYDAQGNEVSVVTAFIPREMHRDLKAAAAADRRSIRDFVAVAVMERVRLFMEESPDSPHFVPPGLRSSEGERGRLPEWRR